MHFVETAVPSEKYCTFVDWKYPTHFCDLIELGKSNRTTEQLDLGCLLLPSRQTSKSSL